MLYLSLLPKNNNKSADKVSASQPQPETLYTVPLKMEILLP